MPQSDPLKDIASAAAASAERLVYSYPTRFSDIEAAKAYVATICINNAYTYGLKKTLSLKDTTYVKDRVHFLVATKAFVQGEFYLDTPLPDRNVLRKAVESDIQRVLQLIQRWPRCFFNAHMALNYIASACAFKQFVYTPFEGVTPDKFRRYVHFNAARYAFQNDVFEMRWPPVEWIKKSKNRVQKEVQHHDIVESVLKPLDTLLATIKADIARLTPLLPPWPPSFLSLNAARNFVNQAAFEMHFHYTGWPDLEANRFRLFVNFNTAKEAWKDEKFAVEEQPDSAAVTSRDTRTVEKEEGKVEDENENENKDGSTTSSNTVFDDNPNGPTPLLQCNWGPFIDGRALAGPSASTNMATNTDVAVEATTTAAHDVSNSLNPGEENPLLLDIEVEHVSNAQTSFDQLVAVTKDPFKNLLTEFGRAGVLKKAFE